MLRPARAWKRCLGFPLQTTSAPQEPGSLSEIQQFCATTIRRQLHPVSTKRFNAKGTEPPPTTCLHQVEPAARRGVEISRSSWWAVERQPVLGRFKSAVETDSGLSSALRRGGPGA